LLEGWGELPTHPRITFLERLDLGSAERDLQRPVSGSIRAVAVIGLAALCVLLLGNALVLHRAAQALLGASTWVEHTMAVNSQLQLVGSLLRDAETGQRGYLVTGQEGYLQPYEAAIQQLPGALQNLRDMTTDNPEQIKLFVHLQDLNASKLKELENTIALYRQGNPEAARAVVQTNLGKNDMDEIRQTLAQMQERERILLLERKRSLQGIELKERVALVSGLVVGLFSILSFGWALNRMELVRERATIAVLESEEWLSTTLGSIGDAVIATDAVGNVRFLNRIAQDLTQFSQAKAEGRPLREVFPIFNEITRAAAESPVEKAIASGKVVGLANHTVLVRPDGTEIAIDDSAAPILDRSGKITGVVMVFRDVSEQRKVENAMRTSEKLAATGKLAATVAHEINNPLEAAANLLYLMRDDIGLTAEGREYLRLAEEQLSRVSHITRQTLAFYRDPRQPEPLALSTVCDRILELYRPRIRNKSLQVKTEFQDNLTVFGTEGELAQVVSNLVANAIDAADQNGSVVIRVARGGDHQGVITVADNGSGISPANLGKVFEPFFTTKKDVGTGLGLWVSKEIVEKLGGTIAVSSPGENLGATFSISLPLYDETRHKVASSSGHDNGTGAAG
jgi:PAS domain S-box-containing protein